MVISVGRLSCIALVLVAVAGCAPRPVPQAAPPDRDIGRGEGGLGAYLAGRYAHARGDTRSAADLLLNASRRDPENVDLQQRAFSLLLAEGRFDEAMPIADRLLIIDGESALPNLAMGVRDARDRRFDAAARRFATLPQKGINGFLGPLLSAWMRHAQGDTDAALALLAPRSDNSSFAPIYEFHAGLIAEQAGRAAIADQHYAAALARQTSVRTVEAVGGHFQRTGRMDEAAGLYQRYLTEHNDRSLLDGRRLLAAGAAVPPTVSTATEGLAEVLFDTASLVRQGNAHDLALVFSRLALTLRPDFPLAQLLVADTLGRQRRLAEANVIYRAVDRRSHVADFARLRLAYNLDEVGDTDAALAELRALAAAQPANPEPVTSQGDILRRHKRYDEAAKAYDQAIARVTASGEPANWTLHYARGITLERSRQWERAEKDFIEALRQQPDQPDVLNYLGYSWVDQGINLEQGRLLLERAVQQRPRDGAIVDSLGWALYRLGDFHGAVKHLERAAELKPEDPTINEHLGDALWQVGRVDEARFQWNRAMSLDPEPEQIEALKVKAATGQLAPAQPVPAKPVR